MPRTRSALPTLPSPSRAFLSHAADRRYWSPFGPWHAEPDSAFWVTAAGLPGAIWRNTSMGCLCGYVAVPRGHLLYGMTTDDILKRASRLCRTEITYAGAGRDPTGGAKSDEDRAWWWLGFDCNHAGEMLPTCALGNPLGLEPGDDVYRTWSSVTGWVEELAAASLAWKGAPDKAASKAKRRPSAKVARRSPSARR